jgi:hypothetical protein
VWQGKAQSDRAAREQNRSVMGWLLLLLHAAVSRQAVCTQLFPQTDRPAPVVQQTESSTVSPRMLVTRILAHGAHALPVSPWNSK